MKVLVIGNYAPSLILFRGGKPAERIVGYKPKAYLKQKIDAVL